MRLRMLGMVAVLVLVSAGLQTQGTAAQGATRSAAIVGLNKTLLDKLIPLLRLEAASAGGFWWDQDKARGMSKQEYVALKNALMIAQRDAADLKRVSALPFDDGSRAARQANVTVYRANAAELNAALTNVPVDPSCAACAAAPFIPGGRR